MEDGTWKKIKWFKTSSIEELQEKVCFNRGIPPSLNLPPWRVPSSITDSEMINQILNMSFSIQASTIPSCTEFPMMRKFILAHACQNVAILMKRYLDAVGISSNVVCGVFKLESTTGLNHVFLEIGNHIIDNSYSDIYYEDCVDAKIEEFYTQMPTFRKLENYVKELPSKTGLKIRDETTDSTEIIKYMEVGNISILFLKKYIFLTGWMSNRMGIS